MGTEEGSESVNVISMDDSAGSISTPPLVEEGFRWGF